MRRTPLLRRKALQSRPRSIDRHDPAVIAWKTAAAGFCQCGCGMFSMRLERHHVIYEQHVRLERGDQWDLANGMMLRRECHRRHHDAIHRIPVESIPESALAFAVDLLGESGAAAYIGRYYATEML